MHRFRTLLAMVFLSGASGLVYQVVWHRYLGILLGVQARATAIVLAVFLGGISLGYFVFGRWSRRPGRNLLLAYASIEIGMAFWGFLFPHLFQWFMPLTGWLYRAMGINSLGTDLLISLLLIGPPTILMGGTLPLLTQAFSKSLREASRTHASIYAWNTLGACVGCLMTGYFLIPEVGLALSCVIAGMVNALISFMAYFLFAKNYVPASKAFPTKSSPAQWNSTQWGLMGMGFLSGFTVIALETVLVRLMGLASGASNNNFTLIVTLFIFGLGFGGLITRRIETYSWRRLVFNQLAVSAAYLLLYFSGDYWSYGAHLVRSAFRDNVENYFVYQALLGAFYFSILIVPVGLAGLTLPLLFHFLKDDAETLGERVGQLYAFNTIGCVLGASIGGYWLFHWMNLDQILKLCITLSLLGAVISMTVREGRLALSMGWRLAGGLAIFGIGFGAVTAPLYDRNRMTQAFRHPEPIEGVTYAGATAFGKYLSRSTQYVLFKDGPNTSVGVGYSTDGEKESSRSIFVNGKSDGNTKGDRLTTQMLAHLPALLSKKLHRVCVIGFGTGMTIGALTLYEEVSKIDVAEISSTIIEHANAFDAYNYNVSKNPKVRFHEMDAFRLLHGTTEKYDVIVSEPSNPWVMGIENLYSDEFYEIAARQLTEGGVFTQWIHTYSFSDSLLNTVFATMGRHFSHVSVFQLRGGDLALVASQHAPGPEDLVRAEKRFGSHAVKADLVAIGIDSLEAVLAYQAVPDGAAAAMAGTGTAPHRLETPRLSDGAAKAFFSQSSAKPMEARKRVKEFFVSSRENSLLKIYLGKNPGLSPSQVQSLRRALCQGAISANRTLCQELAVRIMAESPRFDSDFKDTLDGDYRELIEYLRHGDISIDSEESLNLFSIQFDRFKKAYSPIALLSPAPLNQAIDRCLMRPTNDELFGDCMLQKIVLAESFGPSSPEWITRYLEWFETLPKTAKSYQRKKEAGEILRRIAQLRN